MDLEIISESTFQFAIKLDGKDYFLKQNGGEWRLDGLWIASRRIEWPEALARALRKATGTGLSNRVEQAISTHS